MCYRLTVFWRALWCLKEVGHFKELIDLRLCLHLGFAILPHVFQFFYFPFTATLLVAINEIKKSAKQHGLSFYEYGMCNRNLCHLKDFRFFKAGLTIIFIYSCYCGSIVALGHYRCLFSLFHSQHKHTVCEAYNNIL